MAIPSKTNGFFTKLRSTLVEFPLLRGMLSYAIIWPSSSIAQEYIENGTVPQEANLARAARFSIFGAFFMAPFFYSWMKFSSRYFTRKSLKMAIARAAVEQVCYSPFAVVYFFFGMNVVEFKPISASVKEVREKFWPTYTTGLMFWPVAQTFNFYFVAERNRIIFVSLASFGWTVYLAHVKGKESSKTESEHSSKHS